MVEEGHLQLKFELCSFDWRIEKQHNSEPVVIHQLPWVIRVNYERDERFRCDVICNSESPDTRWSCVANVILRVLMNDKLLAKSEWKHTFNSQENSCGIGISAIDPDEFYFSTWTAEADIKIPKIGLSLADRMMHLLSNGLDANVHFLVGTAEGGKEKFAAHKGILATVSDVFATMFNFDSEHGNADKVIEVTDVKPEAFRVMLNFIYTTNLGGLNQDNVFDILHAAKKYEIADLIDACADCPKLEIDNVLYMLSKALFYEMKDLVDRYWKLIERNARAVLGTEQFLEIDQTLLCDLFARDQLNLGNGEIAVWNAALRWADAQCHKRNMEATGDNRRNVLGPALFHIRFPLIEKDQFSSAIVPTQVLTNEELLSVFLYHAHPTNGIPGQYPLAFSCKARAR